MDEDERAFARADRYLSGAVERWLDGWLIERAIPLPRESDDHLCVYEMTEADYREMMLEYDRITTTQGTEADDG